MTETEIQSLKAKAEQAKQAERLYDAAVDAGDVSQRARYKEWVNARNEFEKDITPDAILRLLALVEHGPTPNDGRDTGTADPVLFPNDCYSVCRNDRRFLIAQFERIREATGITSVSESVTEILKRAQGPTILDRAIAAVRSVKDSGQGNPYYQLGVEAALLALSALQPPPREERATRRA